MSHISEHNSEDNESSHDMEYHSKSGTKSETSPITLSHLDQSYLLLNIQFPMPYTFPKPYLVLNKVTSNNTLHKPYIRNKDIAEDTDEALSYIINHFNINTVSQCIWDFPRLEYKQVYYLTYIDTTWYPCLKHLIDLTSRNLWHQNALAQERLELQIKYIRYTSSDDINPYLLQCLL